MWQRDVWRRGRSVLRPPVTPVLAVLLIALVGGTLAACDYGGYGVAGGCGLAGLMAGAETSATPSANPAGASMPGAAAMGAAPDMRSGTPTNGTPASASPTACPSPTASATASATATAMPTATITPTATTPPTAVSHFFGGFSIVDPATVGAASAAGVNMAFTYGKAQPSTSPLGAALAANGIKQVAGRPEVYLVEFECHRVLTLHIKSYPLSCPKDYPGMTEAVLLADIQQAVAADAGNASVLGYWVLDDWPIADTAKAKALLPQITHIIHTNAPGKLAICGFGASMAPIGTAWDDYLPGVLDSYTPSGCDLPAFYIYSEPVANPNTSAATFDWTMKRLLAHMRADLAARGWNPASGFVGIGQGWSGTIPGATPPYEIAPTAADMAAQAGAFCRAGAVGVIFYAWAASGIEQLHTPANDPQLLDGVRQGARACQRAWGGNG